MTEKLKAAEQRFFKAEKECQKAWAHLNEVSMKKKVMEKALERFIDEKAAGVYRAFMQKVDRLAIGGGWVKRRTVYKSQFTQLKKKINDKVLHSDDQLCDALYDIAWSSKPWVTKLFENLKNGVTISVSLVSAGVAVGVIAGCVSVTASSFGPLAGIGSIVAAAVMALAVMLLFKLYQRYQTLKCIKDAVNPVMEELRAEEEKALKAIPVAAVVSDSDSSGRGSVLVAVPAS